MNLKKICSFVVIGLFAILFMPTVDAASSATLSCAKKDLKIGESTTCTVYMTYEFTDVAPSAASVTFSTNKYLDISKVTANSTLGWSASGTATGTQYSFQRTSTTGITSGTRFELMSFTLTLNQNAKNLGSNDTCGDICISEATINGVKVDTGTSSSCFGPTITVEECVGSSCNAETGAFLNYSLIVLGVGVAFVAILVARRSNKFYRL